MGRINEMLELVESNELPFLTNEQIENNFSSACYDGNLEIIKTILQRPISHIDVNKDSAYYLRCAVENNHIKVVDYLLSNNDPIKKINMNQCGQVLLTNTIYAGRTEIFKYILNHNDTQGNDFKYDMNYNKDMIFEVLTTAYKGYKSIPTSNRTQYQQEKLENIQEMLEFLILKTNFEKNPFIEKYLKDCPDAAIIFQYREMNRKMNNLEIVETTKTKSNKI